MSPARPSTLSTAISFDNFYELRATIIAHRVLASFHPLDNAGRTVECARIMEFPLAHSIKDLGSARTSSALPISRGWQCYFSFERGARKRKEEIERGGGEHKPTRRYVDLSRVPKIEPNDERHGPLSFPA